MIGRHSPIEFLEFLLSKGFSYTEIRNMRIKRIIFIVEEFIKIEEERQKQLEKTNEIQ